MKLITNGFTTVVQLDDKTTVIISDLFKFKQKLIQRGGRRTEKRTIEIWDLPIEKSLEIN